METYLIVGLVTLIIGLVIGAGVAFNAGYRQGANDALRQMRQYVPKPPAQKKATKKRGRGWFGLG